VSRSAKIRLEAFHHASWAALQERFGAAGNYAAPGLTPFQHGNWLRAWFDTLGAQPGMQPIPLELRNAKTGEPVFGVPLVKHCAGTLKIVEFADGGLTDYNLPLVGAEFAGVSPNHLLSVLRRELGDADQLHFRKMPTHFAGQPNPFARGHCCCGR